jgi:hypothetical protein
MSRRAARSAWDQSGSDTSPAGCSAAVTLAKTAHCPVAIIRNDRKPLLGTRIAVVVDNHPDCDEVVHHAIAEIAEARLRNTRSWR